MSWDGSPTTVRVRPSTRRGVAGTPGLGQELGGAHVDVDLLKPTTNVTDTSGETTSSARSPWDWKRSVKPDEDTVCRYGGEEFAVLLPRFRSTGGQGGRPAVPETPGPGGATPRDLTGCSGGDRQHRGGRGHAASGGGRHRAGRGRDARPAPGQEPGPGPGGGRGIRRPEPDPEPAPPTHPGRPRPRHQEPAPPWTTPAARAQDNLSRPRPDTAAARAQEHPAARAQDPRAGPTRDTPARPRRSRIPPLTLPGCEGPPHPRRRHRHLPRIPTPTDGAPRYSRSIWCSVSGRPYSARTNSGRSDPVVVAACQEIPGGGVHRVLGVHHHLQRGRQRRPPHIRGHPAWRPFSRPTTAARPPPDAG